jgi:UDP-N-acetylmuramate dehydrogenase
MLTKLEPLSKHCSLRAGGLARIFYTPESLSALSDFLKTNQQPLLFLGLGSNLLVRDLGFDGVVIKTTNIKNIEIKQNLINAESGVTLAKLARTAAKDFFGAEFLSAIPGTLGGALRMNAGAFGSDIWQFVKSVKTINQQGVVFKRYPKDFDIAYRQVSPHYPREYFISAILDFNNNTPTQNIKQLLKKRNQMQPIGLPSCGSVFKNPPNEFAAKLIEQAGLKGFCVGGACVSEKHTNFIINQNSASAQNIMDLIQHIQKTVKKNTGIHLETELIFV